MKLKPMLAAATALAVACGAWLGYRAGQHRPVITTTTNHLGVTSCGWDAGNKCVAVWTRHKNGTMEWVRLSE